MKLAEIKITLTIDDGKFCPDDASGCWDEFVEEVDNLVEKMKKNFPELKITAS